MPASLNPSEYPEIGPEHKDAKMFALAAISPAPIFASMCHSCNAKGMDRTSVAERLKKFEGSTSYMYRCTGGMVTVGVGHAVFDAAHAQSLTWTGSPAQTLVLADFASVAAAEKGLPASSYQKLTHCRMSDDSVRTLLFDDIDAFAAAIGKQLPAWTGYPGPVQEALFDMAYNLGVRGLLKFPKMLAACAAGDWETAATECRRNGIGDARNAETAALFRQALTA
jgi:GH24 family phage-related lysozyme (muramidase)